MGEPPNRPVIEAAIAAQEELRETLGDEIVDATISALRARLPEMEPEAPIEHERRLVTVLFMDVVDSTRIFRGRDPEEMMTILDSALQTLADPVRERGGRVIKFMGDGFLAAFGLHRTRENDADMAVRAGLGILEASRAIADDVARTHHLAGFQIRVGINTGLVVTGGVTEADDTMMGPAVNLASRIETAAPPGGLLISQSTYRQVRGRFDMEGAGSIDAKGFPDPVPVHLVTGERTDRSAQATRGIEDMQIPMVGRRNELDTLVDALENVRTSSIGHTVTIIGDAGIGKSRLLAEFEARLPTDPPFTVLRARAGLDDASVPHSLLRDLVERCFDIRGDDGVEAVRDKLTAGLGAYLAPGPDQPAKIDVIGRFLGYNMSGERPAGPQSPQQLRDRAVAHLVEFFSRAATPGPLLLLLDDLQWADDGSLDVVYEIVAALGSHPVLTIVLARPGATEAVSTWSQLPHHIALSLGPLPPHEAGSLIDSILARVDNCPPELRNRLLEHAGGNPYYLEELVMMCIDDGIFVIDNAAWTVHMDRLATLRVPTTLTGVIRARLDGLPSPEHTVLQQASVVGRVFWNDAVAQVAQASQPETIDTHLRSLHTKQMVHPRDTSAFSRASEYAFTHTLLRDTTYEEVLLDTRRRYHGIVADWLMDASGDREEEFVGLIAGHLEKAGRAAEALEYLTRAGNAAWYSYAVGSARDFYNRALALVPESDVERRYELLLSRQQALGLMGDADEQRRGMDELEQAADTIADSSKQCLVAIERTFFNFYTSNLMDALASAQRAAKHARATGDPALQSRVETTLAWAYLYLQDRDEARTHGLRGLEIAVRNGNADRESPAQNLLGMLALEVGELSEARTRLTRALEIARQEQDRDGAAIYRNNIAVILTVLGDYAAAAEHFSDILGRALEAGDRRSQSSAHLNLAWVAASSGDWETACDHAQQGIALKRRQEHTEAVAEGLLWLGHALVGLGDLDAAETAYAESLAIRRTLEQTAFVLAAEAGLTRVAVARGDFNEGRARAGAILEQLDKGQTLEGTWEPLRIHLTIVEALQAAGDARAEEALHTAQRLLAESAAKITDSADRRLYLEAIPWHRRIRELAERTG